MNEYIISLSMQLPFHENIRMLYGEHCGLGCYQCKLPPTSVSGCIFTYFYLGPHMTRMYRFPEVLRGKRANNVHGNTLERHVNDRKRHKWDFRFPLWGGFLAFRAGATVFINHGIFAANKNAGGCDVPSSVGQGDL